MSKIFGYACISDLHPTIKTGRTSTLSYINRLSEHQRGDYLRAKASENLQDLRKLLRKNAENNLLAYRMPDSLLPMADLGYYEIDEFKSRLHECGQLANSLDAHLSFHPSQFFVLNSATPHVVDSAIKNLNIFAHILSSMQLKNHPTLLVHVGARSTYSSATAASDAFARHYERLSPAAQQYLAVENDQSAHSIDSCIRINRQIGIPVVCDNAHYNKKPTEKISLSEAVQLSLATWGKRTPKLHLSSEREPVGRHAHADFISVNDYHDFTKEIDANQKAIIMVEAKRKDSATLQLIRELIL